MKGHAGSPLYSGPLYSGPAYTCPVYTGPGYAKIYRYGMAGAAVLLLALAGCGHEKYGDSYPATSDVIGEGGVDSGVHDGENSDRNIAGQATDEETGTILFMASPGGGKPPRLIARTNSITSVPTAEFLAREALAAERRAPDAGNSQVPPQVVTEDGNQANPISQPVNVYGTPTGVPTGASTGAPTILKIIQAP